MIEDYSQPDVVQQTTEQLRPISFQGESIFTKFIRRSKIIVKNITLEPVMLFLSFVSSMDRVPVGELLVYKSCQQDFNFTSDVCENIHNDTYDPELTQIQNEVAQYKVYESVIDHLFPVICSFFIGSWSDTFGRKIILYIYFSFRIVEGSMLWLNAYFMEWPKEYMLFSVNAPVALSGGHLAFAMGINSFIADISPPHQRSFRMAMMHFVGSVGRPFGTQMGKWLFLEGGYICVIGATVLGRVIGFAFLIIRLEMFNWKPKKNQSEEAQARPQRKKHHALSPVHVLDSFKTACRERPNKKRFYLWVYLLVMIAAVLPFFGESVIGYNYVMTRFDWGPAEYSDYTTVAEIIDIVGQSICIPLLGFLQIRDSVLVPFLLGTIIARDLVKAFAKYGWMYYFGSAINFMGGYAFSASRSIVSKCVEKDELGKVFALLSSLESLVPIGMSQAYASLWAATSDLGDPWVGTAFLVSAALTSVSLVLSIVSLISLRGHSITELDTEPAFKPVFRTLSQEAATGSWARPYGGFRGMTINNNTEMAEKTADPEKQVQGKDNKGFVDVDLNAEEIDGKKSIAVEIQTTGENESKKSEI